MRQDHAEAIAEAVGELVRVTVHDLTHTGDEDDMGWFREVEQAKAQLATLLATYAKDKA